MDADQKIKRDELHKEYINRARNELEYQKGIAYGGKLTVEELVERANKLIAIDVEKKMTDELAFKIIKGEK